MRGTRTRNSRQRWQHRCLLLRQQQQQQPHSSWMRSYRTGIKGAQIMVLLAGASERSKRTIYVKMYFLSCHIKAFNSLGSRSVDELLICKQHRRNAEQVRTRINHRQIEQSITRWCSAQLITKLLSFLCFRV
jgi:hypothetical protein